MRNSRLHAIPLQVLAWYFGLSAVGHLLWETLQLPLYTIWQRAPAKELAYAVAHCTAGDLLIAAATLLGAMLAVRPERNSMPGYRNTATLAIALGIAYAAGSEWFNTNANVSLDWSYSRAMPTAWGIGLSPLQQWLLVPAIAYGWAHRLGAR